MPEDEATGSAPVRLTGHLRRCLIITRGRGPRMVGDGARRLNTYSIVDRRTI